MSRSFFWTSGGASVGEGGAALASADALGVALGASAATLATGFAGGFVVVDELLARAFDALGAEGAAVGGEQAASDATVIAIANLMAVSHSASG